MALTPPAHLRRAAAAVAVVGMLALGGCTSTFTAQPYTPGVGVNVDHGAMMARGLVLVYDEGTAYLTGQLVAQQKGDKLTKVEGVAEDQHGKDVEAGQLEFNEVDIEVKPNQSASLQANRVATVSAKLTPGIPARLTLTFEKSGAVQVHVPVVSISHADYKSFSPAPEK